MFLHVKVLFQKGWALVVAVWLNLLFLVVLNNKMLLCVCSLFLVSCLLFCQVESISVFGVVVLFIQFISIGLSSYQIRKCW